MENLIKKSENVRNTTPVNKYYAGRNMNKNNKGHGAKALKCYCEAFLVTLNMLLGI